jgi:hypothetical protein
VFAVDLAGSIERDGSLAITVPEPIAASADELASALAVV